MLTLPAAPAPAPRRQLLFGTALVCAAIATGFAGMLALYLRLRDSTHDAGLPWLPKGVHVGLIAPNTILLTFIGVGIFAQWAVYAARRQHKTYTAMALVLTALLGLAIINAQAYIYNQTAMPLSGGAFATLFYVLTGTFVLLMIVGIVFSLVTAFRFLGGRTADREIVTAHALYWYVMSAVYAALWLVVYVTK